MNAGLVTVLNSSSNHLVLIICANDIWADPNATSDGTHVNVTAEPDLVHTNAKY